jgi:hypothetical protein
MKSYHFRRFISALFSVFLLISCGSGGGGMTAGGGIGGTGVISQGAVSAFGSVFVNGTEFDTSNAIIIINGEEGFGDEFVQDNLDIGRVVTVEGTLNGSDSDAVADQVFYKDNVRGPVESIEIDLTDPTTKEIMVLGQIVIINVITRFKETRFDTIAKDDVVEVSGYLDDTGAIRATFLGKTGDITTILVYEVTGFVVNLDTDSETFKINDLKVDYSSADTNALPGNVLTDGLLVEVEGTLDATSGVMIAEKIELEEELGNGDADEVEIMGFVTDVISDFEFTVGNQVVQFDVNTLFVDGIPENIALGVKLEAEGSLVDGILMADEIEFWEPDQIEVEGIVTEVDLTVDPIEFTIRNIAGDQEVEADTDTTIFEDVAPEEIAVGMKIEVKGVPSDIDISVLVADKVSLELD